MPEWGTSDTCRRLPSHIYTIFCFSVYFSLLCVNKGTNKRDGRWEPLCPAPGILKFQMPALNPQETVLFPPKPFYVLVCAQAAVCMRRWEDNCRGQISPSTPEAELLFPLLLQCVLLSYWSMCFPEASCSCLLCHGGCAGIKDVSPCNWAFNVGSGDLNIDHQAFEESGFTQWVISLCCMGPLVGFRLPG